MKQQDNRVNQGVKGETSIVVDKVTAYIRSLVEEPNTVSTRDTGKGVHHIGTTTPK